MVPNKVKSDITPLLENLVSSIQPFANANSVSLNFQSSPVPIEFEYHPELLIPDLTKLICRIITLTPQEYNVTIKLLPFNVHEDDHLEVQIVNTGVDLSEIQKGIITGIDLSIEIIAKESNGTIFKLLIPLSEKSAEDDNTPISLDDRNSDYVIPSIYKRIKENLKSHFTNIKNLEKTADARSQNDGIFLKKVNAIIMAHLDNEGFDMITLASSLALSRSQLHRRLKPIVGYAPAKYIRYFRLQKAKEMLENQDLTIGEVAFRTGFINQSHFTRIFREQYGFNPSDLRRKQ